VLEIIGDPVDEGVALALELGGIHRLFGSFGSFGRSSCPDVRVVRTLGLFSRANAPKYSKVGTIRTPTSRAP
jgi:hypothetical protein